MHVQIIYGVQRYNLDIPEPSSNGAEVESENDQNGATIEKEQGQVSATEWTMKNLKEEIAKLTGVPVDGQRLIRKGATLFGDEKPLSSLNLVAGEKIMVVGNKIDPIEDQTMKSLTTIERTILDGIEGKIKDVDERLQGIRQGYLTKDLVPPALNDLDRQLKILAEDCMKTLELMDAMKLSDDIRDQARAKRKMLVMRVQALLKWHDEILERLRTISTT